MERTPPVFGREKSVTKDELLEFMRGNEIRIEEENYGYTEDKDQRINEHERMVDEAWTAIQDYGMEIGMALWRMTKLSERRPGEKSCLGHTTSS